MRKQYHLRSSDAGLLAWDVHRLIELTADLVPEMIPLEEIRELDEPFWFSDEGDVPTCRRIAGHARLIREADPDFPIILDPQGRVMDGMHRVCKALLHGDPSIRAVRLPTLPSPDFTGVAADNLPY